jgi:hypothetical protein
MNYPEYMSTEDILRYLLELNYTYINDQKLINYLKKHCSFYLIDVNIKAIDKYVNHTYRVESWGYQDDRVKEYSQLDYDKVPPILVIDNTIVDGYHRYCVAKKLGKKTIPAYVNTHPIEIDFIGSCTQVDLVKAKFEYY